MKITSRFAVFILTAGLLIHGETFSQNVEKKYNETPKLVVGIMVDQMRSDYIHRFWDKFGDDGFKRIVNDGFTFTNHHYNYSPTSTGPGHASVYTGATPSVHGVVGNGWYVKELDKSINVVEVPGYKGVGSQGDGEDNKAPSNMLTTTVGDELRLHTNNRSKVVSISRKDRGAILPGGHLGTAYWFEGSTGNFITSSYYMDELPAWVKAFNDRKLAEEYMKKPWETLLPIEEYIESLPDDNPYEGMFRGQDAPVFPHNLPELAEKHGHGVGLVSSTPFSNDIMAEMAIAAIEGENLGSGDTPDLLAVSFSSTDAVGHQFGPASIELQDTYLRLDRTMAKFLNYLDEKFGKDNILLFITADHAVSYVPSYLADQQIPAGYVNSKENTEALRAFLTEKYGEDLFLRSSNFDIFLRHDLIDEKGLDHEAVQNDVARFLLSRDGIAGVVTATALMQGEFTKGIRAKIQQGYNQKRSGDVVFWIDAQKTSSSSPRGTTHGSPWAYDTHVPMHWYGWTVPAGSSSHPVYIPDIAPTVATFLKIIFPSGTVGQPMNEYMK